MRSLGPENGLKDPLLADGIRCHWDKRLLDSKDVESSLAESWSGIVVLANKSPVPSFL